MNSHRMTFTCATFGTFKWEMAHSTLKLSLTNQCLFLNHPWPELCLKLRRTMRLFEFLKYFRWTVWCVIPKYFMNIYPLFFWQYVAWQNLWSSIAIELVSNADIFAVNLISKCIFLRQIYSKIYSFTMLLRMMIEWWMNILETWSRRVVFWIFFFFISFLCYRLDWCKHHKCARILLVIH